MNRARRFSQSISFSRKDRNYSIKEKRRRERDSRDDERKNSTPSRGGNSYFARSRCNSAPLPSHESRKEHRKEPRRGRPRWQRWCATNNNRTHKLLCNYFKILRRVYAAIRRASRDGTYSRDVQSLSSPLLLPPPPLFREFPFSFSFRGRLPPETGLWGESINCRSCARASLFKKQKERKGKSLSSHLLNGRGEK